MATTEPDAGQASFEEEKSAHDFIDLKSMKDVKALEKEEIYAYIDKLHGIIRKYDTNIASYKQKLKHFLNKELQSAKSEKCTQVSNDDFQESNSEKGNEQEEGVAKEISATDAFSFVDEMRQAAKHAENLNNFVYEPTSGMYYDPKTGYYYNAEYGLYYDGNTGCYYSYDQAKDSFEFHSQAQVQANGSEQQQAENDEQDDDVEFDEHGGVITDKATLQQIKEEKQKQKERAERSKRKAKKKKKKLKKKEKKRHKSKKRHNDRRNKSDVEADENSDNESSRKRARKLNDVEDGELSHSSSSSSSGTSDVDEDGSNSDTSVPVFKVSSRFQDIAKQYPPCLRIIVQETNVPELTVGSLHLVTYLGGSLGREGDSDVIIPDVNVSKCHLDFEYDKRKGVYKCRDLGSRNGTILNGIRMSDSLATSNWQDVVHGSVIGIAQTKLLCHVHEGNSTCGLCEPGLLIETPTPSVAASSANTNVLSHREQLKRLQKKYGLENEKFVETSGNANPNYNDRSAQRRIKVGSSTDKEKTEVACVNTEIASSNKGFKMLSKLGWQKGDTLGKTNQGLLTPINVVANEGKTGLGSNEPPASSSTRPVDKRKYANLKITQARYERAKDIFKETEESD